MLELTLDFETHWEDEYTLSKMTTAEYIRDPRFHVHGVGLKLGTNPAVWVEGPRVAAALSAIPWASVAMIGHNLMFDGAVLAWRYGHRPAQYRDTLGMSRALIGTQTRKHGLDDVARYLGIGGKVGYDHGEAAALAAIKGVRNPDSESLRALGFYCATAPNSDVNLTRAVYDRLAPQMPEGEWPVLDWTVRAFTTPVLELDAEKLSVYRTEVVLHKLHLCRELGIPRTEISSNDKFAAHLNARGVNPPMKFSPQTRKQTYAFAKSDFDFTQLANEHPDPFVRQLVEARLEVKSSIEETRAAKLLGIARTGSLPVPLAYSGALNTHRLSGSGGYNLQNLKRGGTLRDAIIAPEGHVILAADLSNIELRVALALANSTDKLDVLRHGGDLYCETASGLFGHRVYPEGHEFYREGMKQQRTVGKVCIARGQKVLTNHGYRNIEDVRIKDTVWDGVEWVSHGGVVSNGFAKVRAWDGVVATTDHVVFLEQGGSVPLSEAVDRRLALKRSAEAHSAEVEAPDFPVEVFDIVNCGPRHRYTVNGRLVHNCDLSLQYGAAHLAFQGMLRVMAKQNWEEDRCKQTVDVWRANNPRTTRRWRECGEALKRMIAGVQPLDWQISTAGGRSVFTWEQDGILLPRGLRIKYPNIRHHFPVDENGEVAKYPEVVYDDARSTEGFVRIYSGKTFENLCQSLATNVFLEQVVAINHLWPVAMTVHDEVIMVVPGDKVEAVMMFTKRIMGTSPTWWPDLPLAASAAYGRSYGDAK